MACDLVGARRVLVVCPAAARPNWRREFERFSPMDRPESDVVIVSFDFCIDPLQLRGLLADRWDVLVIDEAHYLKAKDATRTRAIYKFLAPAAVRVWRLSGTPSPNGRPDELWPHLASAGITDLALDRFIDRFCTGYDSGWGFRVTGPKPGTLLELRALIARMTLRRTVAEVAPELPPIHNESVVVAAAPVDEELWFTEHTMTAQGKAFFHATLKEANDALKGLARVSGSTKARVDVLDGLSDSQPMAMLRRYIGLSKVPPVVELLSGELTHNHGMKIVLFAAHRDVITMLRDGLKQFGAVVFYGGQSPVKRQKNIEAFRDDPKCRVFIGHITAAGTAIDGLQNQCREVGIIEPSWVPGENAQAVMRVHRRGVRGSVRARWFSVGGSIDEQINDTLRRKANDQLKILA